MKRIHKNISLLKDLNNRQIAIIGYGSQGRAQALNLRDSGVVPIIGLKTRSNSRKAAKLDGFEVVSPVKAIARADVISILIPDHKHKELFEGIGSLKMLKGKALIFAHGMSVAFGLIKPPRQCDLILVAPHGPGVRIRELYQQRKAFTSFWGVEQNYSGEASKIARAYAAAIGCPPRSLFKSDFRTEATGDIFGEQAVLCGGLAGLMQTGFETLVKKGFAPETAYLECIYQLDLIIDLVKKYGPAGMFERISVTAAFGSLASKDKLFDAQMRRKLELLFKEIENGKFANALMRDGNKNMRNFQRDLKIFKSSRLQKTHASIIKKMKSM